MFKPLQQELGIDTFVSFNGMYVEAQGEAVYENPLPIDELAALEREADALDHPIVYMKKDHMVANRKNHLIVESCIHTLQVDLPTYNPNGHQEGKTYQAMVFCIEEEEKNYLEKHNNFDYVRWHEYSMDVLAGGVNKATAIRKLVEHLGLNMNEVYAFGDALNDIEMMQMAGTGVAMGNADQEVKEVADIVTRSVDDNGIEHGLKQLGLI